MTHVVYPREQNYTRLYGPFSVTHDGGASQSIMTTSSFCDIVEIIIKCTESSTGTATLEVGWSGDTDVLVTNAQVPKTADETITKRFPTNEITSATEILGTVGGGDSAGEWNIWLLIADIEPNSAAETSDGMNKAVYDSDHDDIVDKAEQLDDGGGNTASAADTADAVTKKHTQNTDTYLDFGGANEVSATQAKVAYTYAGRVL